MLWSRKHTWPIRSAVTDHPIDTVGDLFGLSPCRVRVIQAFSFQPRHWIFQEFRNKVLLFLCVTRCLRLNSYCSAGVKKNLFIFVCEFVHYVSARRKNAISILSAYSNTFAAFWPVSVPRDFDRRGFDARPHEAAFEEPRRIEILGQERIAHF